MGACAWKAGAVIGVALAILSAGSGVGVPGRPALATEKKATGVLQLDYPEFEITLVSAGRKWELSGREGRAVLPAGSYTLLAWTLRARGSDGRLWQARGGMGIDDIVIVPGKTTSLRLASPLKARWIGASGHNPILMELKFTGTSGEECLGVGVNEQAPPPPRFEVRDATGAVVGGGAVSFCCKFRGAALWTRDGAPDVPSARAGRFTAHVTCDWGPFSVEMERPLALELPAVAETASEPTAIVGQPAIEIALPPVEGGAPVSLAALRDRPVVLAFFCGCGPCSEVAEGLGLWENVHVLAVVTDPLAFSGQSLGRFRSLTRFRGPILLDRDRAVSRRYRAFDCPRVWLVDREGRLAYGSENAREEPVKILAGLKRALDRLVQYPGSFSASEGALTGSTDARPGH